MHCAKCCCGQLSLTTQGDPLRVSICHCFACQRRTGSTFGVQARYELKNVSIDGQSKRYKRTADSGNQVSFYFCPNCGSTVYYALEQDPNVVAVPVGAFADPHFDAPGISVYEARRHDWVEVPANIEHFD